MLVGGAREVAADGISPRRRDGKDLGLMELPRFIDLIREENALTSTMLRAR
jgi:threonyl-tRNA synthetase